MITQLQAELAAQRESELNNLREMVARTRTIDTQTVPTHFPLPKLDLPTFSREYVEW